MFDFLRCKVLAGKPQRVHKNTTLSLLAVAGVFLRHSNFLRHFLRVHYFWTELYIQLSFKDIVKLLESNALNCCLKITTANFRKIGLKIWEYLAPKFPSEGGSMSLTSLHLPPPSSEKYIFLPYGP